MSNLPSSLAVVGTVEHDEPVGKRVPSHWDSAIILQMRATRINLENVLKGDLRVQPINVYYFAIAMTYGGPKRLGYWHPGQRLLMFLKRDSGVLRTSCDGVGSCVRYVKTGFHPDLRNDLPLQESLANLFLTKGIGVTDDQFKDEIIDGSSECNFLDLRETGHPTDPYTKAKLESLTEKGNAAGVRKVACLALDFKDDPNCRGL